VDSDPEERRHGRVWLEAWSVAGDRLDRERWEHVQTLDDNTAWDEAQSLFALVEPDWAGDAGEGLILLQDVFSRVRTRPAP
jgi:hypothetical protein